MSTNMMSAFFIFILFCFILAVQGQVPGDLRLVRNDSSLQSYFYGRLQVYVGGQWGEVCGDDFTKVERDVACHQLGYIDSFDNIPNTSYGDIGTLMLSEVDCFGNDDYLHLLRCAYKTGIHSCQRNYVSLNCSTTPIWDYPYTGQLRLINGDTTSEGMVLVYCNGTWGTICTSDSFNDAAADLICRQLGYTSAKSHGTTRQYSYRAPIWFDSLTCNPSPNVCLGTCAICSLTPSTSCSHYYDLTIKCVYEALHYTLGSNVSSCRGYESVSRPRLGEVRQVTAGGVVEVVYGANNNTVNNTWVSVCGSNYSSFNYYNARTLCQQLGYNVLVNYTTVSSSRPNDDQLNVRCSREYPHILWCPRTLTTCNTSLVVTCRLDDSDYYFGQVRLVGGKYPSEGRVEVYDNQRWVTVSTSNRINENSDSVCRQLGYTGAYTTSSGTLPGNSSYAYIYAYCYSSSSCFSYCLSYPYSSTNVGSSSSYHSSDLFVNCTFDVHRSANVRPGSRGSCRLYPPPTYNPSGHSGAIAAGVTIPLVAIFIMIFTTVIVLVCYSREKKASRRRRAAASDSVRYNTAGGQNIAYVVQPAPGGYMTTPQGMVLVPVVPTTANNQVAPSPNTGRTEDEEKNEPLPTDEYTPLPSTTQS